MTLLIFLVLMAASAIAQVVATAIAGVFGSHATWRRSFSDPCLPMALARRRR